MGQARFDKALYKSSITYCLIWNLKFKRIRTPRAPTNSRRCALRSSRRSRRPRRRAMRSCAPWPSSTTSASARSATSRMRSAMRSSASPANCCGVRDSLELATRSAGTADEHSLAAGQRATLQLLASAFDRFSIQRIDPPGAALRPDAARGCCRAGIRDRCARQRAAGAAVGLPAQRPAAAPGPGHRRAGAAGKRLKLQPRGPSLGART